MTKAEKIQALQALIEKIDSQAENSGSELDFTGEMIDGFLSRAKEVEGIVGNHCHCLDNGIGDEDEEDNA